MDREMIDSGISWIGRIPATWKINTVFQIFTQVKNKNTDLREKNLLSLSYGKIKRKDIESNEGLLPESFDGYNIIEADDIVLRLTDLQNDQRSLRVGLATERGIVTSAYVTIRNRSRSLAKYLYYYLHSFDIAKGFYGMGAGVRQGLNWDGLKWVKVLSPSVDEQQRIVTFLDLQCDRIDSIVEQTKASIEEYKKLRQSIVTQAVTRGVFPDRAMVDSSCEWIAQIPDGWEIQRLKSQFEFGKGLPITKENLVDEGIPVISYGQIHSKSTNGVEIQPHLLRFVSNDYLASNPQSLVHKGDFIFADTSEDLDGCGNATYVDKEMVLFAGYHTIVFFSRSHEENKYLAYQFRTDAWRSQIRAKVSGVKLFSISRKILGDATIIVPPREEAAQIVEFLDEKCSRIDQLIFAKQQLIMELELYKRAMIYEYVTGKKEVPVCQ